MSDFHPEIKVNPSVLIYPDGKIVITDGEFERASCREAVQVSLAWAMECIAAALTENLTEDTPYLTAID
jgi:hypothetical protein